MQVQLAQNGAHCLASDQQPKYQVIFDFSNPIFLRKVVRIFRAHFLNIDRLATTNYNFLGFTIFDKGLLIRF
jgi:hypothetical protein